MPSARPAAKLLRTAAATLLALALSACETSDQMASLDRMLLNDAQSAEQSRDYGAAIHHYTKLYETDRNNPAIIEPLARNLRYAGRLDDARRLLEDTLAKLGPQPRLLVEKGKDEIGLGRADLAAQTLSIAVQGAPTDWEAPATLAIALDRLGRYDEAAQHYNTAIARYPENADILNNFALSRALAGDIGKALDLLRRAVALPSASPKVRENLAFLQALQQQPPRAGKIGLPAFGLQQPDIKPESK
ncbi:MAG: tetratricopeptide repeat protein, partial [Rhodospirillaceae bacterium]